MKGATWKKQKDGRWTASLGARGNRVRVHQLQPGGTFYRDFGGGNGKGRRKSLGTTDKQVALERAKLALAEWIKRSQYTEYQSTDKVSLGFLWELYQSANAEWRDNAISSQRDDKRRAKLLIAFFGDSYDVMRFSENEQRRYEGARRQGFALQDGTVVKGVRQSTIWADIVLLHSMLRWGATKYRLASSGKPLLSDNPLSGVKNRKESSPLRPVANDERYEKLLAATFNLESDPLQKFPEKWRCLRLFLKVANVTGRRLSAIRHLQWSDINFDLREITWRAEFDKKGREATLPLGDRIAEELAKVHEERGRPFDGWLFPAIKNKEKPVDKRVLTDWMILAEQRANLPKLKGGVFHPFRRKFASDNQAEPVKQVMVLGGWKDQKTMQTCYVQVSNDQLRALANKY
jgi:integrase